MLNLRCIISREQDHINAECKWYEQLIGCKIVGLVQSDPPSVADQYTMIGLACQKGKGRNMEEFTAWIQSDPEGNGRGHLEIEKQ